MTKYDAAVIGSGPAGITAALYLARSGCSVLLFESLTSGGQLLQTEAIENYPGFPKAIRGYELADNLTAHLEGLPIEKVSDEVVSITGTAGEFSLQCSQVSYLSKTVVLCCGARHRQLGISKEKDLVGRGISYCAICDGNFFRNKDIAVVGGGNAALEESLYLSKIAAKVHLIHRRDSFRGLKVYEDKLMALSDKVVIHRNTVISEIIGDTALSGLVLENVLDGSKYQIQLNGLFIYVGFEPSGAFVPKDVARDGAGFVCTDTEMRTNIPGIFAAGDIRSKMCRQVITAAGDGATAAQSAFVFLEQLHA